MSQISKRIRPSHRHCTMNIPPEWFKKAFREGSTGGILHIKKSKPTTIASTPTETESP